MVQQKQYVGNIWIDILSNIFLLNIAVVLQFKLNTGTVHIIMTYLMIIVSALQLTISPISCAFHNLTSIDGKDFPYVYVTSLQNNSFNCLINNYDSKRTTVIQNEELSACNFQLFASYNVVLTLEVVSRSNSFIYVELEGQQSCTGRFLLLTGGNKTCSIFLHQSNFLLHLQGYLKLVIRGQSSNSSELCHRWSSGYESESTSCIIEYNYTVTCSHEAGYEYPRYRWLNPVRITEECSVKFPFKCNSNILGHREYKMDCDDFPHINKVLIFYPIYMKALELIKNNITQVSKTAFQGLYRLEVLSLSENNIKLLIGNLFEDLLHLLHLDLSRNRLDSLKPRVFNGLSELKRLSIAYNQLTYLDESVFKKMSNLKYLKLNDNILTYITSEMLNVPQLYLLDLSNNDLNLTSGVFSKLAGLWYLSLWNTAQLELPVNVFDGLQNLEHLILDWNNLNGIYAEYFYDLKMMKSLKLNRCQLTTLKGYIFLYLTKLELLSIQDNELISLKSGAFRGLNNLLLLRVSSNRLKYIEFGVFRDTPKLVFIDFSANELTELPDTHLLLSLGFLNLKENPLTKITKESFSDFVSSTDIYVSQQEICECFIPIRFNCSAAEERSPYLTCHRLLSNTGLAVITWIIGINALLGNLFVLVVKQKSSTRVIKVQDLFLLNLALSDFLMGIYMLIIASADIYFGNYFPMQADKWRSGITCILCPL